MVKNPINPDLQLWIGAIERVQRAGISKIAAIHRGFSFYGDSIYRNEPRWEIPIALKTIMPSLPIVCDPSHICGRRDILLMVSQRAMDLGMEGLMIETHLDPDNALSDSQQQITPKSLKKLLASLEIRDVISPNKEFADRLAELRHKIDDIDRNIVELFGARMEISKDMGRYKKENGVTILQLERWKEIVHSRGFWAKSLGLSEDFIERYLEELHKESIRIQEKSMNDGKDLDDEVMW
jgi:chorismate mutase